MRFLIVEDNPVDAELLRYLLETRFPGDTSYLDATSVGEAVRILERLDIDLVILDLNLPDSNGAETFLQLQKRFPHVPVIVMTHNKDRHLAIQMVRDGAADYILKDLRSTDENIEQVFTRISFALARHQNSVRVPKDKANLTRKIEKAQANMLSAHQSGQHAMARDTAVETTAALADLAKKMVVDVQAISNEMTKTSASHTHIAEVVSSLERELIRGYSNRPSMRSQVDLMDHRLGNLEGKVAKLGDRISENDSNKLKMSETLITSRTKVLLGILGFLGVVVTAVATYEATIAKSKPTQVEK